MQHRHGHPGSRPDHHARIREDADVPAPEARAAGGCDDALAGANAAGMAAWRSPRRFPTRGSCASRNMDRIASRRTSRCRSRPSHEDEVSLTSPLRYDHQGARRADGTPEFLPHVGNLTRNIVIRSENPQGTRGHMMASACRGRPPLRRSSRIWDARSRACSTTRRSMRTDDCRCSARNQIGRVRDPHAPRLRPAADAS